MKATGKMSKEIGAKLLAPGNLIDDYEDIKAQGEQLAETIVDAMPGVQLRAVYHRTSAMLSAMFRELDERNRKRAALENEFPENWSEA